MQFVVSKQSTLIANHFEVWLTLLLTNTWLVLDYVTEQKTTWLSPPDTIVVSVPPGLCSGCLELLNPYITLSILIGGLTEEVSSHYDNSWLEISYVSRALTRQG